MKRPPQRQAGKPPLDLIEEATHLLRTAPAATLAVYYLGAMPFVLGLLYFWADMSRSPLAPQHLAPASLSTALLYFWMKFWQTHFALRLRAQAAGEPLAAPDWLPTARIVISQVVIQSTSLFLFPLALICVIPTAWVFALFQNATVLNDGTETGTRVLFIKCRQQAMLWPLQNHLALALMAFFSLYVFVNLSIVSLVIPSLCKTLFGIESIFTRSPWAMANSTFFAAMFGLTYLCVDPVIKSIYVLRCFYGSSLQSGEDLKVGLKPYIKPALKSSAAILFFLAVFVSLPAKAGTNDSPAKAGASSQAVPANNLDQALDQTIHERKFVWRMPREQVVEPEAKEGVIMQFLDKVGTMVRDAARHLWDWGLKILRKLFPHHLPEHVTHSAPGYGWIMTLDILLYSLIGVIVIALVIFLYRLWRGYRRPPPAVASEAIQPVPDIADENVRADQLPEDGWTSLARELLEKGEFRLAMRAFYLAGLANLAGRNLISIARFKSNREYERELQRRAHALPELLTVFGSNLSVFERIWYGMYEANRDLVLQFAANLEKLKAGG